MKFDIRNRWTRGPQVDCELPAAYDSAPNGAMSEIMRVHVLVACEFSGIVRDAFIARGHYAMSCDLLPTERPGPHAQCDVRTLLTGPQRWDLLIAHPPCTHLAVSGARWFRQKRAQQEAALDFVRELLAAPVPHIALENPVSIISSRIRKPDQIIQPWQFGHGETKATCWWLKNLPPLQPTQIVDGRAARVHRAPPSPDRWKERSRTLPGIAAAIADQWGAYVAREKAARCGRVDGVPLNTGESAPSAATSDPDADLL